MKLRTKFAIVLLLVTVVLTTATYGGLEFYKQQQISDTQQSVDESAELTANQIEAETQRLQDYVGYVASRPEAANFDRSDAYADEFLANSRFWAAIVVNESGTAVAFRGGVSEEARERIVGSDLGDAAYVEPVLETGEIHMTQPEYVNATDTYSTTISAPIFDEESEVTGVLAAAIYIDTSTFFTMVAPLETSAQTVRISAGNDTLHATEQSFSQPINGSATVEGTGWDVTVSHSSSGLRTQLRNLAIAQGAGLFIVLSLVVVFGYWQYSTNLKQTERLLTGFRELEQGDYDYELSLGAGEEWIQISDGFNHLSHGLKEREQQLRERQQRLEVLYRVLRHNLRNEMSVIQNYADIIREFTDDETIDEAAGTILSAGRDLIGLSETAREIQNAMESADTSVTTVDVAAVVEDVVADLREEYPDVDLAVDRPETAPVTAIGALETAVENVCENACKHNDADDPRVGVTVDGDGDPVRIVVEDNGPGIPEQEQNVLEKGRETDLEHGSGLGLWLVFWIIDKSGGQLAFDENEPRGSVVTIELDAAEAIEADEEPTAEVEAPAEVEAQD